MKKLLAVLLIGLTPMASAQGIAGRAQPETSLTDPQALSGKAVILPPTIADLVILLKSYKPDLEKIRLQRIELDKPLPESGDAVDLAREWHAKAQVAEALGETERRLDALTRALAFAEKSNNSGSNSEIGSKLRIRQDMQTAMHAARGLGAGIDTHEKFIEEFKATAPGSAITSLSVLSNYYVALGNMDRAKKMLDEADRLMNQLKKNQRLLGSVAVWATFIERGRGNWLLAQGKLSEAELAFQASVRMAETHVQNNKVNRSNGRFAVPDQRVETWVDLSRRELANAYVAQQRLDEAELILREVLKSSLQRDGRNSRLVAMTLASLGRLFLDRGRHAEALVIVEWAERTFAEAGFPVQSLELLNTRKLKATLMTNLGRYAEAVNLFDELKTLAAVEAREGDTVTVTTLNAIPAYIAVNRGAEALVMADKTLKHATALYGADHYYTAEARGYRAMALQRNGQHAEARTESQRAVATVIDPDKAVGKQQTSVARASRLRFILNNYLNVLVGKAGDRSDSDTAEAFRVADVARWQSVQKAVSGSALRAASGTPELAIKIKQVQDNDDELQSVYKNLIAQRSAPPEKQLPVIIAAMEKRIVELQKEQIAALAEIRKQFPQYDALVNPRPADVVTAAKALNANEALVSVYVTKGGTYVWALNPAGGSQGKVSFHFSDKNAEWIAQRVKKLRDGVDFSLEGDTSKMRFDLEAASAIYQELLAPVEIAWAQADTLLVVANESLGQLPFSVLPTRPVAIGKAEAGVALSQYRQIPWLGRTLAVAYLPSVSALVTLRSIPSSQARRDPFIGFGDPDFGGPKARPPKKLASVSRSTRNLKISHSAKWDESQQSADVSSAALNTTEVTPVLTPLPDTRAEILAIATAMRADTKLNTYFGAEANVQSVKLADLKHRRIVAFATHGLVAGDLPGLDQPALALSPTAGQDISDGLLKLEDILKLSLDADLVVLSACNTAAADGSGSEAVSGLGRAFFYAGSRSVLATHWPVETVSARQLVTELFERYANDGKMTRAKALQNAMLEMIDRGAQLDGRGRPLYSYAHPAFWAPYALYGDPGR